METLRKKLGITRMIAIARIASSYIQAIHNFFQVILEKPLQTIGTIQTVPECRSFNLEFTAHDEQ